MGISTRIKKALGQFAVIVIAGVLWTSAIAGPSWEDVTDELRTVLPAGQAEAIITQARSRGAPPESVHAWARDMRRAQQAGVPVTLLGERLAQGLIKGVPLPRIAQALSTLQVNLAWTREVIDRHAAMAEIRNRPEAVEQAARQLEAALRAGFERGELERMLGDNALTLDQIAGFAGTAGNLRISGVEPERAAHMLAQAAGAGMTAFELARLEHRFVTGIAAGRAPKELMAELERRVEEFGAAHQAVDGPMDQDDLREEMKPEPTQDFRDSPSRDMSPGPQDMGGPGGWR